MDLILTNIILVIMIQCEICGNELNNFQRECPFCGNPLSLSKRRTYKIEVINLEKGFPTVAEAEKKLHLKLSKIFSSGINIIKIIHGYGSTGVGGKIRIEIRKSLMNHKINGPIRFIVFGENFNKRDPGVKKLLQKYPDVINDVDYSRGNKGITIIAK